jgi:hypothetical protein
LAAIRAGRGNGTWTGTTGITSSAAAADVATSSPRGIGWREDGGGAVTFAFAAPGDTDLDWKVDILDVAAIITGGRFDTGLLASWSEGDFDYDGVCDVLDIALFLAADVYDTGPHNPPAPPAAGVVEVTVVPEPAHAAVWAGAVVLAVVLRRRH